MLDSHMNEREKRFLEGQHELYFVCPSCGNSFKRDLPAIPWAALPVFFNAKCSSCETLIRVTLWGDKKQGIHIRTTY